MERRFWKPILKITVKLVQAYNITDCIFFSRKVTVCQSYPAKPCKPWNFHNSCGYRYFFGYVFRGTKMFCGPVAESCWEIVSFQVMSRTENPLNIIMIACIMMTKLGNICFGSKICVREAKCFWLSISFSYRNELDQFLDFFVRPNNSWRLRFRMSDFDSCQRHGTQASRLNAFSLRLYSLPYEYISEKYSWFTVEYSDDCIKWAPADQCCMWLHCFVNIVQSHLYYFGSVLIGLRSFFSQFCHKIEVFCFCPC